MIILDNFTRMAPDEDEIRRAGKKAKSKWYVQRVNMSGKSPKLQPVDWRGVTFSTFTFLLLVFWTVLLYKQYTKDIRYMVLGYVAIILVTLSIASYKTFPVRKRQFWHPSRYKKS